MAQGNHPIAYRKFEKKLKTNSKELTESLASQGPTARHLRFQKNEALKESTTRLKESTKELADSLAGPGRNTFCLKEASKVFRARNNLKKARRSLKHRSQVTAQRRDPYVLRESSNGLREKSKKA